MSLSHPASNPAADSSRRQHRNPPSLKRASQDVESRWLERHSGIIWKVVHVWHNNCGVPLEDLRAIASIGALKACRKFDESKLEKVGSVLKAEASLTYSYANGEVMHFLRAHGKAVKVPRLWREQYAKVRRLAKERGKPEDRPTMEAIARELGLKEWRRILAACTMPPVFHPDGASADDAEMTWDAMPDPRSLSGDDDDDDDEPEEDPRLRDPEAWAKVRKMAYILPDRDDVLNHAEYLRDAMGLPLKMQPFRHPQEGNGRAFRGNRPPDYLTEDDPIPYQFQLLFDAWRYLYACYEALLADGPYPHRGTALEAARRLGMHPSLLYVLALCRFLRNHKLARELVDKPTRKRVNGLLSPKPKRQ